MRVDMARTLWLATSRAWSRNDWSTDDLWESFSRPGHRNHPENVGLAERGFLRRGNPFDWGLSRSPQSSARFVIPNLLLVEHSGTNPGPATQVRQPPYLHNVEGAF